MLCWMEKNNGNLRRARLLRHANKPFKSSDEARIELN